MIVKTLKPENRKLQSFRYLTVGWKNPPQIDTHTHTHTHTDTDECGHTPEAAYLTGSLGL